MNKTNQNSCYNKVIKSIQNKNGYTNESYNYNNNQSFSRKSILYEQQMFNYLSNKIIKNKKNTFMSNTNCQLKNNGVCDKNKDGFCLSINNLPCNFQNYKFNAVYKRSNPKFSKQGAVSGGSRINRLKYQTQLKSQSRIVNNKTNKINGTLPGNLYGVTAPSDKKLEKTNDECDCIVNIKNNNKCCKTQPLVSVIIPHTIDLNFY